jgi:hypothetical protein
VQTRRQNGSSLTKTLQSYQVSPPLPTFTVRARARAAAGEPPEAVTVPVINPKPQWEVFHMGWGNPKSNIEPSNPKHPNYVAPSPDNHLSTPPPPTLQEVWLEPQPRYLFGQSAHQSTDNNDESIQDDTYDVDYLEENDTYKCAEGGHYKQHYQLTGRHKQIKIKIILLYYIPTPLLRL